MSSIYDIGIKLLKTGTLKCNGKKWDSLDFSTFGYNWQTEKSMRGEKHKFPVQYFWDNFPQTKKIIESHINYYLQLDTPSPDFIINFLKNRPSLFYVPWNIIKNILTPAQLIQFPDCPDDILPDHFFPYRNMGDNEILSYVAELADQTGNRTQTGISAIRNMRSPAPALNNIRIIQKKTWRETENQIRIGQTNSRGGYCKYAIFLTW